MTAEERIRKVKAEQLANTLISKWELDGWTFKFNHRKRNLGVCRYGPKSIELSLYLLPFMSDYDVKDTILHEIAHALDWRERGESDHGPEWRRWAVKVGANPSRLTKLSKEITAKSKYTLICPNGHKVPAHRKRKRESSCAKCDPNGFNEKFKFTVKQNW
jgi:predicted SprT family Zn-dependent metalloprotease